MDVPDPDALVAEQIAYYRACASEYDRWWLHLGRHDLENSMSPQWLQELSELSEAVERLMPRGRVLEIAAGTGNYTSQLVRHADHVTALDSSPEALEVNRAKLGAAAARVEYVVADIFGWKPPSRYDAVFFAFWLTHVPPGRFERFWSLVDRTLAPSGRAIFVDNAIPLEIAAERLGKPAGLERVMGTRQSRTCPDAGISIRELTDGLDFPLEAGHLR